MIIYIELFASEKYCKILVFLVDMHLRRTSWTLSHHCCVRKSPIRNPTSNLFSSASTLLWQTTDCIWHIQLIGNESLWSERVQDFCRYRNPTNPRHIWCILEWFETTVINNLRCDKTGRYRGPRGPQRKWMKYKEIFVWATCRRRNLSIRRSFTWSWSIKGASRHAEETSQDRSELRESEADEKEREEIQYSWSDDFIYWHHSASRRRVCVAKEKSCPITLQATGVNRQTKTNIDTLLVINRLKMWKLTCQRLSASYKWVNDRPRKSEGSKEWTSFD